MRILTRSCFSLGMSFMVHLNYKMKKNIYKKFFLKRLNTKLPYDPAIPREMKTYVHTCTEMFKTIH